MGGDRLLAAPQANPDAEPGKRRLCRFDGRLNLQSAVAAEGVKGRRQLHVA